MNTIHNKFISLIKQKTPSDINSVDLLTDIIPMSKEAGYRRLRGEISFTLEEAIKIASSLNISLDSLVLNDVFNHSRFNTVSLSKNSIKEYCKIIGGILTAFKQINTDPSAVNYNAGNMLPTSFSLKHEQLTRFRLFKLIYQTAENCPYHSLSDFVLPKEVMTLQKECLKEAEKVKTYFIWDSNIFSYFINDVDYFKNIRLVDPYELLLIKKELHLIIDEIEELTITGNFKNGEKVSIYLSPINLDACYACIKSTNFQACSINIFDVNYITTLDANAFQDHLKWVQSLIRHSTLISKSGEMQRKTYIRKQRELVDAL